MAVEGGLLALWVEAESLRVHGAREADWLAGRQDSKVLLQSYFAQPDSY